MSSFSPSRRGLFAGFRALFLGLALLGCSKKNPPVAVDATRFDSAPPELRDKWKAAAHEASRNNYLSAATNLISLFGKSQQLTAEQNEVLKQAWLQLGNKAFVAANGGDQMATEAVLKMRDSKIGDRTGGH